MFLKSFYGFPQMMDASNAINVFDAVDEEEEDRGGWGNKLDFLFSCISVSVGLGSKSSKKFWAIFTKLQNVNTYSVFQGFSKTKSANGGSIGSSLSLSQFLILPQLPQKIKLASKVVKVNSKIIISLPKI
jgi:hypothetical protein